jgi:hypothetical protein
MIPHKHAAMICAYADGHLIQSMDSEKWVDELNPLFSVNKRYRIKPKIFYGRGTHVRLGGEEYILATVGERAMCLINLDSGNRFVDNIRVDDLNRVSEEEMKLLTNNYLFEVLSK